MGWNRARLFLRILVLQGCIATAASPKQLSAQSTSGTSSSNHLAYRVRGTEWGWNGGGAAGIAGGSSDSRFWTLNLRWGRVLTDLHGPALVRGNLEYAVELVPALAIQQSSTVFGAGITPMLFQYNLDYTRRLVPFLQAGAGTLFTTEKVPENTSQINFTPQGGIGVYWFRRPHSALVMGVRYHHISNAGIAKPNPGHNGLYVYTGISWWR